MGGRPLATIQVAVGPTTAQGNTAIPLSSLVAVSSTGSAVPVTAGTAYSLTVLSRCDFTADGKTDFNDVLAAVNADLGKSACPSWLSPGNLATVWSVLSAGLGGACGL